METGHWSAQGASHTSQDMLEVRWHGRGGQGVVTAGEVLAEAAHELVWLPWEDCQAVARYCLYFLFVPDEEVWQLLHQSRVAHEGASLPRRQNIRGAKMIIGVQNVPIAQNIGAV